MSDMNAKAKTPPTDGSKVAGQVEVVFVKSSQFRVVHADGVWYEGDPHGNIHLIFYNERTAVPQAVVYNMDAQGQPISEAKRVQRGVAERELEFDVVLSFATATQLRVGLERNLKNMQAAIEQSVPESVKQAMKDAIIKGAAKK